ncbi:MAG: methyltransferase domain-containing protein [Bacteroidetes bacterium]|nr:methyltransferase domain-containing protein [Bacteroidota bacterium]MBM3423963.1 methyltransferase domain-containing protein [Bacteroidota bacterium]
METERVSAFYDSYVREQAATGINDRIYGVYERLIGLGLNAHSSVLELGCGIGMMTSLLKRTINQGQIHAIDLSEASIAYGKEHIATPNLTFSTQDITAFETTLNYPDYITLIDVLEHVPLEKHAALFERIAAVMGPNTRFVINLPNPDYIAHDIALEAHSLQVIDQPVPFAPMIQQLDAANLELMQYEKYGIWHHDEYQWFVLRLKRPFKEETIDSSLTLFQKFLRKIKRFRIKRINNRLLQ